MFSFVTVFTGMSLGLLSISFIDTRDFPGGKLLPPGPIGYQFSLTTNALTVVPSTFLFMNNWLADGLLVRSAPKHIAHVTNVGRSASSIVAILSIP